jgi:hypothetical protein
MPPRSGTSNGGGNLSSRLLDGPPWQGTNIRSPRRTTVPGCLLAAAVVHHPARGRAGGGR